MVESKLSNFQSNKANNLEGLQNIIFDRPGATVAPICNCSQPKKVTELYTVPSCNLGNFKRLWDQCFRGGSVGMCGIDKPD